jgi:hypothetical protein
MTAPTPNKAVDERLRHSNTLTVVASGRKENALPTTPTAETPQLNKELSEKPAYSFITPGERESIGWKHQPVGHSPADRRPGFERLQRGMFNQLRQVGELTGCYGVLYLRPYSPKYFSELIVQVTAPGRLAEDDEEGSMFFTAAMKEQRAL